MSQPVGQWDSKIGHSLTRALPGVFSSWAGASRFPHSVPDNKSAVRGSTLIPQLESRLWYIPRVPAKEPKRDFKVGDKVRVNLHHGKIEDAVVRAVIEHTDGLKLQVDFGHEQTALIEEWQVVKE